MALLKRCSRGPVDRPLAAGVGGSLLLHAALWAALELIAGGPAEPGGEASAADGGRSRGPISVTLAAREPEERNPAAAPAAKRKAAESPSRAGTASEAETARQTGIEESAVSRRPAAPIDASAPDAGNAASAPSGGSTERGGGSPEGAAMSAGSSHSDNFSSAPIIVAPRPVDEIRPAYPLAARKRGYEGTAVVSIVISPTGTVLSHHLVSSSGYDVLDRAALDAVLAARFYPGTKNGRRETLSLSVAIAFDLS